MKKIWKSKPKVSSSPTAAAVPRKVPLDIYMLTYSIPENFGGMTNVLLHRARSFANLGEKRIDVLTLDADMDLPHAVARLEERGYLGESNVRLRNVWHEISELSDTALMGFESSDEETVEDAPVSFEEGGTLHVRKGGDGSLLQLDRYRSDGTLWAIDRRDTHREGSVGGRRISLYARNGTLVGQWTRPSEFYFAWLDCVIGSRTAALISDSQFVGGFVHNYKRPNVVVAQVVHSTHLESGANDAFGPLSRGKGPIMKNADAFDLVTVLTESQRDDVASADLVGNSLRVIPNSRSTQELSGSEDRPSGQGVMISRLTSPKRVEDAVRATVWASHHCPGLHLDIYGDGGQRANLERLIDGIDGAGAVSLKGYNSSAAGKFRNARFSVLSSKFEGFGLVLVESMAAGCIPIAYDIKYGPSDIITDGVDGFLVPSGDVHGLAAAIHRVASMRDGELARMQEAAVLRSKAFSDSVVMKLWMDEIAEAWRRKSDVPAEAPKASIRQVLFTGDDSVRFYGEVVGAVPGPCALFLSWLNRDNSLIYSRMRVNDVRFVDEVGYFSVDVPMERLTRCGPGPLDFSLDISGGGNLFRERLKCASEFSGISESGLRVYSTIYGNLSIAVK